MTALVSTLAVPAELNPNGVQIRMAGTNDNPLFCLADVCQVLGLTAPHMVAKQVDDDDRSQASVIDSAGRSQDVWFITEAGLYTIVVRSDKPAAKPFRKWVCGEVLPCIRKHGCYPAPASRQPTESLEVIRAFTETAIKVFSLGGGMDYRDQVLLKDWLRGRAMLDRQGEGPTGFTRWVAIPERCVALGYPRPPRGIDSQVGKSVASAYRAIYGREPHKHQQTVEGRVVEVNSYTEDELDAVDTGIRAFYEARKIMISRQN